MVNIGEIARGIAQQDKRGKPFARKLREWLDRFMLACSEKILPVDIAIARKWGELSAQVHNSGVDILLAATALEHNLTVVTRDGKHFGETNVTTINPWQ